MNEDVLDRLGEIEQADVVRCARIVLRRPLLRTGGPDGELLGLVYRHRNTLTELFSALLGYRLVAERRFARLYKAGPGDDQTRGEQSLTPRGYAHLALSAAALTGVGAQVLLSRLVADVYSAATEAGIAVSDELAERRSLAAALRYLISLGVITETDGSVTGLLTESNAEALITIDTALLGRLVVGPLAQADSGPRLVALAARPGPREVEHTVRRRLVEQPVTLYADLPDEQARWLRRNVRRETARLERFFGLLTETRLEGVAVTDPEDYLTDVVFPGPSTVARIALLALPELLSTTDDGQSRVDGWVALTRARAAEVCAAIVADYPAAWSKQAIENPPMLLDDLLRLLTSLGLARSEDGENWLISPAAHRWLPQPEDAPRESVTAPQPEPGWSLFDEPESVREDPA